MPKPDLLKHLFLLLDKMVRMPVTIRGFHDGEVHIVGLSGKILPSGRWAQRFGTYKGCSFLRLCLYYRQFTELKAVNGSNTRPQHVIWGSKRFQ
jgi:hypothetical protein